MTGGAMTHDEAQELLAVHALDAVDGREREQLEDHLRDCPRCRAELVEHRDVAARLASVGSPAPAGVWERIAAELDPGPPARSVPRLLTRRPPWVARVVGVAAVLLAVALGALGWHLQSRVDSLQHQVAAPQVSQLMARAALDPASIRFAMTSPDRQVRLTVVISPDGTGYIDTNHTLATLGGNRTYQLWGVAADRTVSLAVMGGHPSVVSFPAPTSGLLAMAITAERAGGVVQTTQTPLAVGKVPS